MLKPPSPETRSLDFFGPVVGARCPCSPVVLPCPVVGARGPRSSMVLPARLLVLVVFALRWCFSLLLLVFVTLTPGRLYFRLLEDCARRSPLLSKQYVLQLSTHHAVPLSLVNYYTWLSLTISSTQE